MARLLPSTPDTTAAEEAAPRVIGLDSDGADDLISALSSDTARGMLASLHEEPATPSAVADRLDTSLQNAQYHLNKLQEAGLIEEIDTCYSEKGREMSVFAPADRPLVVVAGTEEDRVGLQSIVGRILGAVAILGIASAVVEQVFGRGLGPWLEGILPGFLADDTVATDDEPALAAEPGPEVMEAAEPVETALGLPPGALFFAGGLFVIACFLALHLVRRYRT